MNSISKSYALILGFVILLPFSLFSQVPAGGTEIIKDPLVNAFTFGGNDVVTMSKIAVTDQLFTKAFRLSTTKTVLNSWNAQISFPPANGIVTNDVILVTFFARTTASVDETGLGLLTVCLEKKITYDKVIYQVVSIGTEWKQYYVSFKSPVTLLLADLNCAFHIGFPSQTIEMGDIHFINYANTLTLADLPVSLITYVGQEPDAAWRAEAEDRISQIRKGNIQITVVDSTGAPVENAEVSIGLARHKFSFGSAITASDYLSNPVYKEKILEMFNEVVFENDLKWGSFYYKTASQKNDMIKVLDDLDSHSITMRGHNVLWPSYNYNPAYLANYKTQPEKLRLEIDKRIDDVCKFTKGRVVDWDVINEPYSEHEWMDLLGKEAMADWFKRVRNNDPYVKMYLNDFNILSGNGTNIPKQDAYMETVSYIDNLGGGVQGIGFQGHFGSDLTPIPRLKTVLDKFSVLGKDIKITEFDIEVNQDSVKADYTRDFMTMMFSHPSVTGVLMWGFWESRHWKPTAAMYNANWSIRPNGVAFRELILNKWWTKDTIQLSDASGIVNFNGFLGNYSYTVKYDGQVHSGKFDALTPVSSGTLNQIVLSTHPDVPAELKIKVTGETVFCEGGTTTLSVELPSGFNLKWFNSGIEMTETAASISISTSGVYEAVATGKGVILQTEPVAIIVNSYPVATIDSSGSLSFCSGGSVILNTGLGTPLTYKWFKNGAFFQGSLPYLSVSESGKYKVEANSLGCKTFSPELKITKLSSLDALCSTGILSNEKQFSVSPNPFEKSFTIESSDFDSFPVKIELIDSNGRIAYQSCIESNENKEITPDISDGLYILKIETNSGILKEKIIRQN